MTRILVTGFGPFPGMPDNPTATLVTRLADRAQVTTRVLDTRWDVCAEVADEAARADLVLMFGVAGQRRRIAYERLAHAAANASPDVAGRRAHVPPPLIRYTRLDVQRLAGEARAAGFPVTASSSAGTYICNASYASALSANPHSLFVHVPKPTRRGPLSPHGLERHARWLLRTLREVAVPELRLGSSRRTDG